MILRFFCFDRLWSQILIDKKTRKDGKGSRIKRLKPKLSIPYSKSRSIPLEHNGN